MLVAGSDRWNQNLVLQTFTDEEPARILRIKPKISQEDSYCWGLHKHGSYSTQSGYRLTETIVAMNHPGNGFLPPLERSYGIKAPPKLKLFCGDLYHAPLLSKNGCSLEAFPETPYALCVVRLVKPFVHVLFTCDRHDKYGIWRTFHYHSVLFSNLNNHTADDRIRQVSHASMENLEGTELSHLQQHQVHPHHIVVQAYEDADLWRQAQAPYPESDHSLETKRSQPPEGFVKCNILMESPYSIAEGLTLTLRSKEEANLYAMLWPVESMGNLHQHNVLFEASEIETRTIMMAPFHFPYLQHLVSTISFKLEAIEDGSGNSVAVAIATSVTTGQRYQSYVAAKGPAWLSSILFAEAAPGFLKTYGVEGFPQLRPFKLYSQNF
ncbi:hypothetical protein HID58_095877, partial [Brassica napus]